MTDFHEAYALERNAYRLFMAMSATSSRGVWLPVGGPALLPLRMALGLLLLAVLAAVSWVCPPFVNRENKSVQ